MVFDQKPDGSLAEVPLKRGITLVKKFVDKKVDKILYLVACSFYPLDGFDNGLNRLKFLHLFILFDCECQLFSYRLNI